MSNSETTDSLQIYVNGDKICQDVTVADSVISRMRGRMFTRDISKKCSLVFQFNRPQPVFIHMMFVPYPLGVIWIKNNTVQKVSVLRPWIGSSCVNADTVIETHPTTAQYISVGDKIEIK